MNLTKYERFRRRCIIKQRPFGEYVELCSGRNFLKIGSGVGAEKKHSGPLTPPSCPLQFQNISSTWQVINCPQVDCLHSNNMPCSSSSLKLVGINPDGQYQCFRTGLDPDPYSDPGGQKVEQKWKKWCSLDVLLWELKASSVIWTFYMDAKG